MIEFLQFLLLKWWDGTCHHFVALSLHEGAFSFRV